MLLCTVVANLVGYGMFMDGLLYNAVAHNMVKGTAQSAGSFWFPHFAPHSMSFFHEQPPLTFFIESLFFRAFGDGLWVERLYSLTTLGVSAFFITQIWTTILPEKRNFAWLPLFFWIITPCVAWSYSNCMEENTMSIFVLASVLLQIRHLYLAENRINIIFSGILLVLASLCKGFPGLFPLGLLGFAWLSGKTNFKNASFDTLLLVATVAFCYFSLYLYPTSRESLGVYLNERVLNSIKNVSTEHGRFWLAQHLIEQSLPSIILVIILYLTQIKNKIEKNVANKTAILIFLFLGLSGSLPLMVTAEQRGFYLSTSIPDIALAFAFFSINYIENLMNRISENSWRSVSYFSIIIGLAAIIFVATKWGGYTRDADKWQDMFAFKKFLPNKAVVQIQDNLWEDWELRCGLNRLSKTDFITKTDTATHFYIIDKTLENKPLPIGFQRVELTTQHYDLYKK